MTERKLIGPAHAHLDAPCTDACYEPAAAAVIVYLALGSCGDYYCDEEHPLGIFSTEELARARHAAYQKAVNWEFHGAGGVAPLTIDEDNPDFAQYGGTK